MDIKVGSIPPLEDKKKREEFPSKGPKKPVNGFVSLFLKSLDERDREENK